MQGIAMPREQLSSLQIHLDNSGLENVCQILGIF